jgi:hypothetical protein
VGLELDAVQSEFREPPIPGNLLPTV